MKDPVDCIYQLKSLHVLYNYVDQRLHKKNCLEYISLMLRHLRWEQDMSDYNIFTSTLTYVITI